jgi:hypothetical protein
MRNTAGAVHQQYWHTKVISNIKATILENTVGVASRCCAISNYCWST